jgi:hypothetical protein
MTLELKDIIYLMTYILSMMGMFFTLRSELHGLKKENGTIRKIVFGERGKLNLVDSSTCEGHRKEIIAMIRRNETILQMVNEEMKEINKNLVIIMVTLDIRSPNGVKQLEAKKD